MKEGDLFAGKYAQRFSAKQFCRKCHVPLAKADDHMARDKLKTVSEIRNLISKGKLGALKAISQTYLTNCFYSIRFSMGNDYGIHGSCPSELLHAFLLGTFKYLWDIFLAARVVSRSLCLMVRLCRAVPVKLRLSAKVSLIPIFPKCAKEMKCLKC